jgi:hypothetical protein
MMKKKCGCVYDGPVQAVSCGQHNAAAKNLDRAQVMLTKKEIEIHHLTEALKAMKIAPSKNLEDMTITEKTDWGMGNLTLSLGRGDFRGALVGIILAVTSESYNRGVKGGIEQEKARWKEREKRRRARAR